MLTKDIALRIIETYKRAWETQDPELILTIFHADAEYGEYLLTGAYKGHDAIKAYWQRKVVKEQSDIMLKLLSLYIDPDADTAIAEWDARFYNANEQETIHLIEVAILHITDGKIKRLRECCHSERL